MVKFSAVKGFPAIRARTPGCYGLTWGVQLQEAPTTLHGKTRDAWWSRMDWMVAIQIESSISNDWISQSNVCECSEKFWWSDAGIPRLTRNDRSRKPVMPKVCVFRYAHIPQRLTAISDDVSCVPEFHCLYCHLTSQPISIKYIVYPLCFSICLYFLPYIKNL